MEGNLSQLIHSSRSLMDQTTGRPPVHVDELVAYSNHVSFSTNAGLSEGLRGGCHWRRGLSLPPIGRVLQPSPCSTHPRIIITTTKSTEIIIIKNKKTKMIITMITGVRHFDQWNRPLQHPLDRDPRFLMPYPPDTAMRVEVSSLARVRALSLSLSRSLARTHTRSLSIFPVLMLFCA